MGDVRGRMCRLAGQRTWSALPKVLLAAGALALAAPRPARAEGSRELLANGGDRALTEWRTSRYGNALRRRTFLKVYANAGETINLGSSAAGVGLGDIVVWNPGLITTYAQSQSLSLPAYSLSCRTAQPANGKLTTRAQELAGPLPASGGYTPCTYTAPSTGTYWVAFYGPSGGSSDVAGSAGTTAVPVVNSTQNSGVSAFDITVRNGANTVTYAGRAFTDYLVQQTGGNGAANRIYSTLYAVTKDGFKYQVDMRGLDPNAYVLYGNTVGFLNPDGITPLYHDLYDGANDSLTAPRGGVTLSPPTGFLFFNPPDATLPVSIVPTPLLPSVSSITFSGSAGGVNSAFGIGGNFVYVGNVGGVSEVVITPYPASPGTCETVTYDPNLSTNRVLRAALPSGVQNLPWDGKDNAGANLPVSYPGNGGPGFCFRATLHAGEYHFPLLDAENSMLGGPTITLLNPPGGTCPLATCRTAFFDDRGYKTTNGTTVGTVGSVLPGSNPPPSPYYSTAGFDTASTTIRKYGNDGSTGFGDKKGLDLWTYFPSPNVVNTLYVVPQNSSDLAISKIHSGDFAIGVDNTYTITVRNVGTASISGTITVTDPVPASLPVQSVSGASPWSCGTSGQNVTCTAASTTLAAGASLPDITLTVRPVAPPPTTVTNTATVSISGATDTNSANDTSSSPTTITSADLGVTKSASPTTPAEGATVTYTVTVTNNGPSTADDVSVADAVPSGLTFVSAAPSQGTWESGTWTVGTLLNGASATLTLSATVNLGQSGQTIGNTATASGGPYDYAAGNNSASASLTVPATVLTGVVTDQSSGLPLSGASVQVTDSLGHVYTVTTGADGRYTVTGSPGTPLAAGPATVTASLAGYVPTTATPTVVAGATATQGLALAPVSLGGVVTDLGTGVPVVGATVELRQGAVTCTATTGAGGTYFFEHTATCPIVAGAATVTASATGYQDASASPTILSTGPTTQDLAMGTADLLITKTDGKTTAQPGETLVYTIAIVNQGSVAAAGIDIRDTVGSHLTLVSDDSGLTRNDLGGGVYQWTGAADLPVGGSLTFHVTIEVASALPDGTTSLSNYVKATTTTAEKDKTNNEVSDVDTVTTHPDLTIAKTFTSTPPAGTLSTVSYSLAGGNVGHATATGVTVIDTFDSLCTYDAGSASLLVNGGSASFTSVAWDNGTKKLTLGLPNLAPTDTYVITYTATVGTVSGSPLVNTAAISGAETDLDASNGTASVSVPTANNADVYVLKSGVASPSPAAPGGQIVYTLSYGNNGTDTAAGVTITDALPANTTLVSGSITGGGTESGGTVTWSLGDLASRATGSVGFAVEIAATLPADVTSIDNTATIATTTTEPNTGNNSASESTPVTAQPDLVIAKTAGRTQVLAGDSLAYTITYENVGNQAATGVTITDALLNGLDYVSSSPSGTYDSGAGTVTWSIGALAVDGPHTITLNATVKSDAIPSSVAADRVTISDDGANGTDPNPGDNTATDSDLVVAPYVVLEKRASSPAYDGQPVTYTIDWRNAGAVDAGAVVIRDDLPAGTSDPTDITGGGTFSSGPPRRITWDLGTQAAGASGTVSFRVVPNVGAGGATQSAPTLSTESGTGSVTVTSSATTPPTGTRPWCELDACASFKLRYQGADGTPQTGWNDNPRLTAFDDTGWTAPIAASTAELAYWTAPGNLSAEWVAPNTDAHLEGNFTFFRQAFCVPLNATGVDGTLQLAGDDVSDIYLNGVYLGQKVGAGAADSFPCAGGIQSGINFLAVQLLNNRHGGHALPGCPGCDHIGLLFNLGASYTGLRPFASGPSSALAGQSVTIAADETALGGRKPYTYRFDFGDGTVVDYQDSASYAHTYASPGVYTAVVTARAGYGCTGTDQVVVAVLPATSNLLANPATVAYTDANAKAFAGTSGAGVELGRAADLSVAKTVTSGGTVPGQGVTYQVVVTNNGPDAVTGATVTDTMPAALTGVTWTCSSAGGGSCAHASGSGNVGETVDLPSGATATYTITGTILTTATGTLANTATVAPPAGVTDLVAGNDGSTVSTTLAPTADLSVTKTSSPKPGQPGQALTYTITVQNAGPSAAVDASVADTFPSLVGGVAWTCSASGGSSCTASGVGGIADTVTLASGGTLTYTAVGTLDAAAAGTVENTVTVSPGAGTTDGSLSNNSATDGNTPVVTVLTGIVRTGSGSGPVLEGATVTVTDAAGNTYTTTTDSSGRYTFTSSAGSPLAVGAATVVASLTGYEDVTATPALVAGTNTQDLVMAGADFEVTKSGVVDVPCGLDCQATYTIRLENVGSVDGTSVVVEDVLPADVAFDQSQLPMPGVAVAGVPGSGSETVTWTVGGIASGSATSLDFKVNVLTIANINNCAVLDTATPADTNTANDTGCALLAPTYVGLTDFRVVPGRSGNLVEWETVVETGTAGFHLYRWDARRRAFGPVRSQLLPGVLGGETGATYSFLDEGASPRDPVSYLLVEQETNGERLTYGPFSFGAGAPGEPSAPMLPFEPRAGDWPATPAVPDESSRLERRLPDLDAVFSRALRADDPAEAARTARVEGAVVAAVTQTGPDAAASLVATASAAPTGGVPVVRIGVRADGLYFLKLTDVGSLLGLSRSETRALLDARKASLTNGGLPVAWFAAADGSGLYFYGQRARSQYADENVYWLSNEGGETMATSPRAAPPAPAPAGQWFTSVAHFEEDLVGATGVPDPEPDFWFWKALNAAASTGRASFPIQVDGLTATGTAGRTAVLRAHLWGATSTPASLDHHVTLGMNGVAVGEDAWDGRTGRHDVTASFSPTLLREGQNSIDVAALLVPGVPYEIVAVDWFELSYPRLYRAKNGTLLCSGGSNQVVSVEGFSRGPVFVLDVSDPRRPVLTTAIVTRSATGGISASFYPSSSRARYFVAEATSALTPASLRASTKPSRLLATENRADWVILTGRALEAPAARLAERRRTQGLETMIVFVDEVMDAFNRGVSDPRAIRDFVTYARGTWAKPPRYLVLAGDGTYDYRDVLGKGGNLVPPLMTATPFDLAASDTAFADSDGDGVPEIAVGRLPVLSAAELDAVVAKIAAYEDGSRSATDSRVLLVADLPDSGGDFTGGCEDVAAAVPRALSLVEKSYRSQLPAAQVRSRLLSGLASGAGFVNYSGHATPLSLSVSGFLKTSDVGALGNAGRLPVLTAVTCYISAFQSPSVDSLGELLVLQPEQGAIAVVSSSGLSMDFQARTLSLNFHKRLWDSGVPTIGEAFRRGLAEFVGKGGAAWLARTYVLIGDPATRTRVGRR